MNLPHKEPLLFAKKAISRDVDSALVEIEFNSLPTLAMYIEAAAQAFSFIDKKQSGTWGVIAMIKDAMLIQSSAETSCLCEIKIAYTNDLFYRIVFRSLSKNGAIFATGEVSIRVF